MRKVNSNNDIRSMDSATKLFSLCNCGRGRITRYSDTSTTMKNGIEYYYVEITSKDGIQYGIQVFGEEAIALYNITMKIIQDTKDMDDHKVPLPRMYSRFN
jgi:hypothetical protein